LTLRGRVLLEAADVVIYDYLANPQLLEWAPATAEKVYVGKKGGSVSPAHQGEIHRRMIEAARRGLRVVRLKGGDPFIFGRGGEEAEALVAAGIPFEVVPGVTSAIAAPAYAGIPLTHRDRASTVTFVTGHEEDGKAATDWGRPASASDTLVVLMGMGNLPNIVTRMMACGRGPDTPIALIRWGTHPHQETLVGTLGDIVARVAVAHFKPPVVMVVGDVVTLRGPFSWFEKRPLFGKKIVVTRARAQAALLSDRLTAAGAEVIGLPAIEIVPVSDVGPLDRALDRIGQYDGLIFTSVNGVRHFRRHLSERRFDLRRLSGLSLCAIGPATAAAVEAWGLYVDVVPTEFRAEGVLDALEQVGIAGKRFLLPRAKVARDILPETIRAKGGEVDVVPVYETRPPTDAGPLPTAVDLVTFASPSSVKNFVNGMGRNLTFAAVACIGPITADCARAHGLTVDVMPATYTIPDLAAAVVEYFRCP
jgi:uroporphyrinogen III methyltransferase/synthase